MYKKIVIIEALLAAVMCLGSCSDVDDPDKAARIIADIGNSSAAEESITSDEEVSEADETISADEEKAVNDGILVLTDDENKSSEENLSPSDLIVPGLWWAVNEHAPTLDGETREDSYYQVNSGGTGTVTYQSSGQSVSFRMEPSADHIDLYFEGQDVATPISVKKLDDNVVEVNFGNNITETWSNMGQVTFEEFGVISNTKLCDMAKDAYNSEHDNGCGYTQTYIGKDGNIVIELYDTVEDKNLLDTYTVARFNGMGTNKEGKPIYLMDIGKE